MFIIIYAYIHAYIKSKSIHHSFGQLNVESRDHRFEKHASRTIQKLLEGYQLSPEESTKSNLYDHNNKLQQSNDVSNLTIND